MQGGFSFCGTDIADLGLEYVPDNANTYVFAGNDNKIHEQAFDGHNGGYFYGSTSGIKIFHLRCIFQESHINHGILSKIDEEFYIGKTGRLVFSKRPWIYYIATITSVDYRAITNYMNGFVTIQLKAYYPFGRCDDLFYKDWDPNIKNITDNSNMLPLSMAQPTKAVKDGSEISQETVLPLYNGGSRNAAVSIELAGDIGNGQKITNENTNKSCGFICLTKELTSNSNKYLVSDAIAGRTVLTDGSTSTHADRYHDYGYLELEPNRILYRDIEVRYMPDGTIYHTPENTERWKDVIGCYIFINGSWSKINSWNDDDHNSFTTAATYDTPGIARATIATVNEIKISPVSTMSLTRANFIYKPTFA